MKIVKLTHIRYVLVFLALITVQSCGVYNFTGGDVGSAQTFQVNSFRNEAPLIEPGLDRDFTLALQDLVMNQTSLDLVPSNGDLVYEGEITEYRVAPMTATAEQTAAQNRLTIGVRVRFTNHTKEEDDFERTFSFFYDFGANEQLSTVKSAAHQEIFERITQDIFNASLANW
ncbi:LPS assembly lipoprotein LptE [Sinomicrobium kalidii]|uniref:LptE family protein n=1 Tax=Sinomicrobium kalidii TaxID=2900738 RepID=UPI001E504900|nr:LptE family protein [Sinomicrobium kalidii]UGU17365.1 LPS assembly lipoprotein LptE [Sinomicrobium kalidii]